MNPPPATPRTSPAQDLPREPATITARIPVWRQISDDIRAAIDTGHIKPGQQLPSETQLRQQYRSSVSPIRRAMEDLRAAGLVTTEHGRGTIVREQTPTRMTFNPYIRKTPGQNRYTVWDSTWRTTHRQLHRTEAGIHAATLETNTREPVFITERHLTDPSGNGRVVHRLIQPITIVEELTTDTYDGHTPAQLYTLLTEAGYTPTWTDTITTTHATPNDTTTLHIPRGIPVLIHTRTTRSASGHVLAVEETRLPGHTTAIASSPLQ